MILLLLADLSRFTGNDAATIAFGLVRSVTITVKLFKFKALLDPLQVAEGLKPQPWPGLVAPALPAHRTTA